ncbi:TonB-dependent receptor domain-containing protein [Sphingomonas sp.]|uniref:TonB-dependent receptor domain-containing protein n=1 Tax=Sphingomonas sp. TaxID=28214 RepID=UPI002E10AB9D|nr:TonB-dependent receptor [Sphingomonas sp.]
MKHAGKAVLAAVAIWATPAQAQRADENAVLEAEDGFGKSVGNESIGIYASGEVRGFSATAAGNNRIEGLYFDEQGGVTDVIVRGSTVRLGLTSFGYPLPAPTGIVDMELRRVGTRPVVSVEARSGEYLGPDLVVNAAIPVSDRFGVDLGFGLFDDEYVSGASAWFRSYGGVARWRPAAGVELTGLYGRYDYGDEEQAPVIYTAGAYLPDRIEQRRFYGQDWADGSGHAQNYGGIVKATLGSWQIAAGAFNSSVTRDSYYSAYIDGVDRNGDGRSFLIAGRDQVSASTSGELRVSRVFAEGPRRHRLLASVRARDMEQLYGGYDLADLGAGTIGVADPVAPLDFDFGERTDDRVRQSSLAVGYELRWPKLGELNLGLTRSDYRKEVRVPGVPATVQQDRPWLWNAGLALTPSDRLTLYAATTRGLEENGVAPNAAVNRGEALPALRTRQVELGLRYALPGTWRLTAAAFDIAKPYFEIDRRDGVFRQLGEVTHRGVEGSLSGQPVAGLSLVAGAVWLDPRVTGQAVDDGRIGTKPIGRTSVLVDSSLDYRLPFLPAVSFDIRATFEDRRVANAANTLYLPARAIVDLGARYRTRVSRTPVVIRAQLRNVGDVFGWRVGSGGGFTLLQGRRANLSVTADF